MESRNLNFLKIGLAQMAPVWLNKHETTKKVIAKIQAAGKSNCDLVVFGESVLPGYPFWLGATHATAFDSTKQKEIFAHYARQSINIKNGDLDEVCATAKQSETAIYLGIVERAADRSGTSLYCSLVYIDKMGKIKSVHRKLQPTYDERLVWAPGDGNGLQIHPLKQFHMGGLNCWENWMPLARSALYGMGETLHIAVWPGSRRNTEDITRFIAKESRSFVVSVSGLMDIKDIPEDTPHYSLIAEKIESQIADGGSCIAGPDGEWVVEPMENKEGLVYAEIDFNRVLEERQNFDSAGHYSRPDVTQLTVNRSRQSILQIREDAK